MLFIWQTKKLWSMATCRQATYFAGMGGISREKYQGEEADRKSSSITGTGLRSSTTLWLLLSCRLDIVSSNWALRLYWGFYTIVSLSLNHDFWTTKIIIFESILNYLANLFFPLKKWGLLTWPIQDDHFEYDLNRPTVTIKLTEKQCLSLTRLVKIRLVHKAESRQPNK